MSSHDAKRRMARGFLYCASLVLCGSTSTIAHGQTAGWTQRVALASPRSDAAVTFDTARAVTVLFGGVASDFLSGETWEWNGSSWSLRTSSGPAARRGTAMAYDIARGVSVLFGGDTGAGSSSETWEWNGSAWTLRSTSGPGARQWHAMAYDSRRGVVVLFGGWNLTDGFLGDTWEWDGSSWTQRATTGPAGRDHHAMVYDSERGTTVLFGGWNAPANLGDTWEWNGTSWTQRSVSGPAARNGHTMTYDSVRLATVLFGGDTGHPNYCNSELWVFNGESWIQQSLTGPAARRVQAMAFDSGRGVSVMVGGGACAPPLFSDQTWELRLGSGPPVLVQGPVNQNVCYGTAAQFTVVASGGSLRYQWQKDSADVTDGGHYSGTATSALTISPTDHPDVGGYRCVVTNPSGSEVSNSAALSFRAATLITGQPQACKVVKGHVADLRVTASGEGTVSYQWRRNGTNVTDGGRFSGTDSASLRITEADLTDAGEYSCTVTALCGSRVSDGALLTVVVHGDMDADGDVDLADFGLFQACLTGRLNPQNAASCVLAKLNQDLYVDGSDLAIFMQCLSGANIPVDPDCAGSQAASAATLADVTATSRASLAADESQTRVGTDSGSSIRPQKIAFMSNRDGNNEIYTVNPDGSEPTNLTRNSGHDDEPSWSPDGTKITFHTQRNGKYEVWSMNADGTGQMPLAQGNYSNYSPHWSPDGTKIVFVSNLNASPGNNEVFVMDPTGSNQVNLTNNAGNDVTPAWTTTGRILFASNRIDTHHMIFSMQADGSGVGPVNTVTWPSWGPCQSPDGATIAFVSGRDGNNEIYRMNSDGSNPTRLTSNSISDDMPVWSRDGSHICFTRDAGEDTWYYLVMMASNGTSLRVVADSGQQWSDTAPAWR